MKFLYYVLIFALVLVADYSLMAKGNDRSWGKIATSNSATFSPDGKHALLLSIQPNIINIIDIQNGNFTGALKYKERSAFYSYILSRNGDSLISVIKDENDRFNFVTWDINSLKVLKDTSISFPDSFNLKDKSPVFIFTNDLNYILCYTDSSYLLWNIRKMKQEWVIMNTEKYNNRGAAITPDSKYIVGLRKNKIFVLTLKNGEFVRDFDGDVSSKYLSFSDDSKFLMLFAPYNTLSLYNFKTGGLIKIINKSGEYTNVRFTQDNKEVLVAANKDGLLIFDTDSLKLLRKLDVLTEDFDLYYLKNHPYLLINNITGTSMYDYEKLVKIKDLTFTTKTTAFNGFGKYIYSIRTYDADIHNAQTGEFIKNTNIGYNITPIPGTDKYFGLMNNKGGKVSIRVGSVNQAEIIDSLLFKDYFGIPSINQAMKYCILMSRTSLIYSWKDKKYLYSIDSVLKLFNVAGNRNYFATIEGDNINNVNIFYKVREFSTGKIVFKMDGKNVLQAVISSDEKYVFVRLSDKGIVMYKLEDGSKVKELNDKDGDALEFSVSPDNSHILFVNNRTEINALNINTGNVDLVFGGYDATIQGFSLSDNPKYIAANYADNALMTWKVPDNMLGPDEVPEIIKEASALVYPEPADKYIILSLPENIGNAEKIEIFNSAGQPVKTILLQNPGIEIKIDVSSLNPGIYFYRVKGNRNLLGKFVVVR